MATNDLSSRENLYDVTKRKAPNGGTLDATNTLIETNDIIKDTPTLPANGGLFHEGMRVTSLPSGSLVDIGGVWGPSKGTEEKFVEQLATIKSQFDAEIETLRTEGPEVSAKLVTDRRGQHIESLGQAWTNLWLNGPTTPTQSAIRGLLNRKPWNAVDNKYVFSVGGTGLNLRSALLVYPSPTTFHFLYNPNHPTLGVQEEESEKVWIPYVSATSASPTLGNWHRKIDFTLQQGYCVRDQRAFKRICNIDCGPSATVSADLINSIIKASTVNAVKNVQYFLYCDEWLYAYLVIGANNLLKVYMSDKNIYQTELPMIGTNIIIRRMDALNHDIGSGETLVA